MGRFSRLETQPSARKADAAPGEFGGAGDYPPSEEAPPGDAGLDAPGCVQRGWRALAREDYRSALRWFSRALDLDSRRPEPWIDVALTHLLLGDHKQAQTWIGRGLIAFPEEPGLMALRAVCHARRGLLRQAMNHSDAVLERSPNLALAHVARGEVLMLADNPNQDYCFEQALKTAGGSDWMTPLVICLILRGRKQWVKALTYAIAATERNEREPALWYHVGRLRAALGQGAKAERAFEQARALCAADDPLRPKLERKADGFLLTRLKAWFGPKGKKAGKSG
ncbi:MAG TPA: tetratricopeptide repeat protein [Candidatus Sumerlaeota bacterium]|nr:tetratricopeptide repeat protein [Candidatus Sumerlaeota bacterium]